MATTKKTAMENSPEFSFEDAMKRLEEIANKLEKGQATLDESLSLYEEGISLVKLCNDKLTHAEQKIRILNPDTPENGI